MSKAALVTLAIGEPYESWWRDVARPGWIEYAARWDHEVVALNDYIDPGPRARSRSPAWQKCLIAEAPALLGFDRLVWIDSDVAIRPDLAPDIVAATPREKIGGILPTIPEGYFQKTYYTDWGLPKDFSEVVNTGVLVITPELHASVLRSVYDCYEDRGGAEWHYEQRPLSYTILDRGLLHPLDERFNWALLGDFLNHYPFLMQIPVEGNEAIFRMCIQTIYCRNYFTHFAGYHGFMRFLDPAIRRFDEFGRLCSAVLHR